MVPASLTIIGPGAMGILFAAKIWQVFPNVSLLHYHKEKAKRMEASGIMVVEEGKGTTVKAFPKITANAQEIGTQEVVLVLVKAFQTSQVLKDLKVLCGPETLVVTLQNGMGAGDILARAVPGENLVLGVTMHGANRRDEKTVVHAGSGDTILGMFNPDSAASNSLEGLVRLLEKSGFTTYLVQDIYPVLWKKLLVNVGINPLTALSGLRNGKILEHPELAIIQERAVSEAFSVMKATGMDIGMDFKEVLALVRKVCKDTAGNVSSMLQDRINGNQTEIDFINGAVARLATQAGIKAPVNEMLCLLVKYFSSTGWNLELH